MNSDQSDKIVVNPNPILQPVKNAYDPFSSQHSTPSYNPSPGEVDPRKAKAKAKKFKQRDISGGCEINIRTKLPRDPVTGKKIYPDRTLLQNRVGLTKSGKYKRGFITYPQLQFCEKFLETGDAKQAAIDAGLDYPVKYLLAQPEIATFLRRKTARYLRIPGKNLKVSKNWYISKLGKIIEGGIPDEPLPGDEKEYSARDALTAGDQLCKITGMYEPEKRVNVNANVDTDEYQRLMDSIKEKERGY